MDFARDGMVKLEGVFDADQASRMQGVLWEEMERRHGIVRGDRSTWNREPPVGMRSSKKHHAFQAIFGPKLIGALDELLGGWQKPRHYGQVLITMPNATCWRIPDRLWHADFQYDDSDLFAVKYWALIDDVEPGGGGTPQVLGTHRVTANYLRTTTEREYKRVRDGILRSHPWLRALGTPAGTPEGDVDGVACRVVECTGKAGDVYVTHPWVMHSIAVNASCRPRLMRSNAVYRLRAEGDDQTAAGNGLEDIDPAEAGAS